MWLLHVYIFLAAQINHFHLQKPKKKGNLFNPTRSKGDICVKMELVKPIHTSVSENGVRKELIYMHTLDIYVCDVL